MIVLDWLAVCLLAGMLVVALINLATAPRLERAGEPDALPLASLLIPARDEAENLGRTLPALLATDYPRIEILLLDDRSTDGTGEEAARIASAAGVLLQVIRGAEPPAGWVGKNWACHQLAAAAAGDVLVFCDADVDAAPAALRRTVAALQSNDAGALTALPRQRLDGWMQAAVVPVVAQLPVAAMLPLRLIPILRSPSLSMANGQWLAFTRTAYARCGGHAGVRGEVLEDVALGRRIKAAGERLVVCVAPSLLGVRMYGSAATMREGFCKNLYPLLGGRPLPAAAALGLLAIAWLYPFASALRGTAPGLAALGLLAALRITSALLFRHGWRTVLLHPAGAVTAAALAVESWRGHARGTVTWRGRLLPAPHPFEPAVPPGEETALRAPAAAPLSTQADRVKS